MRLFNSKDDDQLIIDNKLIIIDSEEVPKLITRHKFPDIMNYSYNCNVKKGKYNIHYDLDENMYFGYCLRKVGLLHEDFEDIIEVEKVYVTESKENVEIKKYPIFIKPTLTQNNLRFMGIKAESCKLFIGDFDYYNNSQFEIKNDITNFYQIKDNYNSPWHSENIKGLGLLVDVGPFNFELIMDRSNKEQIIGCILYLMEGYKV